MNEVNRRSFITAAEPPHSGPVSLHESVEISLR